MATPFKGVSLEIVHLALGGCLKAPPVTYGITADTGGHIAYVLAAAQAQAARSDVDGVTIVTRLFDDALLGEDHGRAHDPLGGKLTIRRIATADRRYLEKAELSAGLDAFTAAFCAHLAGLPRLPDVIHAHFADAAYVCAAVAARFDIPFVYTPHALGIDKQRQGDVGAELDARIAQERMAIAGAAAIVVSTRDEAKRQIGAYDVADAALRVHRIPPGVPVRPDDRGSHTIVDRLGDWLDEPGKPILLVIARPVRKKNIAALLRGYAATPALQVAANIVILAGQHDSHVSSEEAGIVAELRALAATPPLAGRVVLPARHDAADVAALYRRAAAGGVFVNPALHEPFGLTILEAAAAGAPVVATQAGGPAEIVARIGHGVLVDPHDHLAIAAACLHIVGDPARHRRLSEAGRQGAALYDWGRYAADTVALYETLLPTPALLACDIDNTLTGCRAGAHAFAAWAAARGIPFVVATGRSFDEARAVLDGWALPQPDAYIVDVGTRLMIRDDAGAWRACRDHAALLGAGWRRDAVADVLASLSLEVQPPATQTPHKLSFFGDAGTAGAIRDALADARLPARVVFSHERLIDVLPAAGGKATAIAAFAARHGLSLSACIAAGDSGNDLDMLTACGHAILVANADADLSGLAPRRGLYRATRPHAAGVMEGLAALGLAPVGQKVAA